MIPTYKLKGKNWHVWGTGIAAVLILVPQYLERSLANNYPQNNVANSEVWTVKPGSVYDGDTLRVVRGQEELKIRFCGIDAPEKDQPLGVASRDHLRGLIAQGDGTVMLVPIEQDRYGRTVAELFVLLPDTEEEIHLNSQMVADGMAYHYEQYSDSCPNQVAIAQAEEMAIANSLGVWADPDSVKPWDWRRR